MRASLALFLLLGLAAPATAKEGLPPKLLAKLRSAERGDRLGVWESSDHLREGRFEAGYSANTDNVIVGTEEGGVRRYFIVRGPGFEAHTIVIVPRNGDITVRSGKHASEDSWRTFVRGALGEKSAMHRRVRVESL